MSKKKQRELMRRLENERMQIAQRHAQKIKYHHAKKLIKLDKAVTEAWWFMLCVLLWAASMVATHELKSKVFWEASVWFFARVTAWQGMKIAVMLAIAGWHHIRFNMAVKAKKKNDDA